MEIIKKTFTPEFRNRLDGVVQFAPLAQEVVMNVVDKFLVELQAQLDDKRVHLEVDSSAREWLATEGYDKNMGARPMARLIQEKIKRPLADMILFGALSQGGTADVTLKDGELEISVAGELAEV
jgi:ATP-dependent Clp protease ATP-binding subunit ClpA